MATDEKAIELRGSVWMTVDGENFGGTGRVELLARIAACGSITQAAKAMKMSYKAAWDAIESMNNLAGEPLVERLSGGKGGGGTRLTNRGLQLVENFKIIEREHRKFINHLGSQAQRLADDYLLIRKFGIKTSTRNQFFGTIVNLARGSVNDEITLCVAEKMHIVAIVTHASTEELGLSLGSEAFALIKETSILIASSEVSDKFSARNQIRGKISHLAQGMVNSEVSIEVAEGVSLTAIVTNESAEGLTLAEGQSITALFNASDVIVGTPL